jgi:hypothetical protein
MYFKADELWEFMRHISGLHGEPWPFAKETFAEDMEELGKALGMKITTVCIDGKLERRLGNLCKSHRPMLVI